MMYVVYGPYNHSLKEKKKAKFRDAMLVYHMLGFEINFNSFNVFHYNSIVSSVKLKYNVQ